MSCLRNCSTVSGIQAVKEWLKVDQKAQGDTRGRHPDDYRRPAGISSEIKGFQQCYNGQLDVYGEFKIIVTNHQGKAPLIMAVCCSCWAR